MCYIHPSAIVSEYADLHPSIKVGPFCIIEAGAVVGANCVLDSHVRIYSNTRIGQGNRICHGVTLGTEPQDLTYTPAKAQPLVIGDFNHFKECVNISCGVKTEHGTCIGNHNYFMAFSHVGHDCIIGDYNVLANTATLAGHVELAHHIFVSGQVAIHQFCRIGAHVMIAGITGVAQDVPPYALVNGQRARIVGLNVTGLRRNEFTQEQRNNIKQAYKILYLSGLTREQALNEIHALGNHLELQTIAEFVAASKRGLVAHTTRHYSSRDKNMLLANLNLAGIRIVVTRPVVQSQNLCNLIQQHGGHPICLPALCIEPILDPTSAIHLLGQHWDVIIYTSVNAVRFAANLNISNPIAKMIAAIGVSTAKELTRTGCTPNLIPEQYSSEGILELPELVQPTGMKILIVRGVGGRNLLSEVLIARGAKVSIAEVYKRSFPEMQVDSILTNWEEDMYIIMATSGEILDNIIALLGPTRYRKLLDSLIIVASERLQQYAETLGFSKVMCAAGADDKSLLAALTKLVL